MEKLETMESIQHTLYNIIETIEYNQFIELHNENVRKNIMNKNELKNDKHKPPIRFVSYDTEDEDEDELNENISIRRKDSNVDDYMTDISIDILRDLAGHDPYKRKKKKSVSFGEAHGYYIPSRRELFQLINKNDIWWSQTDFINMRLTASNEVREFIRQNPIANYKMCVKQLWTILDFDAIYAKLAEKRQVL